MKHLLPPVPERADRPEWGGSRGYTMTRTSTLSRLTTAVLTAIAAGIFLLLSGAFGTGLLSGPLWSSSDWVDSPLITWLLLGLIVLVGIVQASRLPARRLELRFQTGELPPGQTAAPLLPALLFGNVFWAILALPVRIFVGRAWLDAGAGQNHQFRLDRDGRGVARLLAGRGGGEPERAGEDHLRLVPRAPAFHG